MKVRIKYSSSQKFIASLEGDNPSLHELKEYIKQFIATNYDVERSTFFLSFNGTDPIEGDSNESLTSLGIVNGDLLVVIDSHKGIQDRPKQQVSIAANSSHTVAISKKKMDIISSLQEAVDGLPPQSVTDAFDRYDPLTDNDAMNILIHLAVTERGFFIDNGQSVNNSVLPLTWRDMVCTLKYHHPGLDNFKCTIVIVTMGNVKQVLVSFEGQDSEISVRLETKTFVSSGQLLPHKLTKLSQLANVVRNELLYPLQVAAHLTLGLPAPWHIAGLPQETLISIFSLLTLKNILSLSSLCKSLHAICQDNKLWFLLFKRDFKYESHSSDTISGADWKAKYKDLFVKKKKDKASSRSNVFVPPPIPESMIPPFPLRPGFDPYNPYLPQPRAPNPYPPQPDYPNPNPYYDPDSPYFGGEIPPFPPPPRIPFGGGMPRLPGDPFHPPRGGPRFDFF